MARETATHEERAPQRTAYSLFMLALSLYVVLQLAVEVISNWSQETVLIFDRIDLVICAIFLTDWFYFFAKAENKSRYVRSHFLDFIASIPLVDVLRVFRAARVVRLARAFKIVRGLRGLLPILRVLTANKARSVLFIYTMCTALIYVYCCIGIHNFEYGINPNIFNFGDSLWLGFTTITTVGYGDVHPVTTGGRIMSALLTVTGLGMFSIITAEFAALILGDKKKK